MKKFKQSIFCDKNGKVISENDVLRFTDCASYAKVIVISNSFSLKWIGGEPKNLPFSTLSDCDTHRVLNKKFNFEMTTVVYFVFFSCFIHRKKQLIFQLAFNLQHCARI